MTACARPAGNPASALRRSETWKGTAPCTASAATNTIGAWACSTCTQSWTAWWTRPWPTSTHPNVSPSQPDLVPWVHSPASGAWLFKRPSKTVLVTKQELPPLLLHIGETFGRRFGAAQVFLQACHKRGRLQMPHPPPQSEVEINVAVIQGETHGNLAGQSNHLARGQSGFRQRQQKMRKAVPISPPRRDFPGQGR